MNQPLCEAEPVVRQSLGQLAENSRDAGRQLFTLVRLIILPSHEQVRVARIFHFLHHHHFRDGRCFQFFTFFALERPILAHVGQLRCHRAVVLLDLPGLFSAALLGDLA